MPKNVFLTIMGSNEKGDIKWNSRSKSLRRQGCSPIQIAQRIEHPDGDEIVLTPWDGSIRLVPLHQAVIIAQQSVKNMYLKELLLWPI